MREGTRRPGRMRTFVELDPELVFDVRLLGEVVLVELRADDVSERGGPGERVGGGGGHRCGGGGAHGEEAVEDGEQGLWQTERTTRARVSRSHVGRGRACPKCKHAYVTSLAHRLGAEKQRLPGNCLSSAPSSRIFIVPDACDPQDRPPDMATTQVRAPRPLPPPSHSSFSPLIVNSIISGRAGTSFCSSPPCDISSHGLSLGRPARPGTRVRPQPRLLYERRR